MTGSTRQWLRTSLADFQAPRAGNRISINRMDDRRVDPYYLVENVDKRGGIWSATITGSDRQSAYIGSDQVESWSHYGGQQYPWDERQAEEEVARQAEEAWQAEMTEEKQAFEAEGSFPSGRVLRENLVVKVKEGAPDPLDLFADQRLRVVAVDMKSKTALMNLMGDPSGELASLASPEELAGLLASPLPASLVVEWTEPAAPERSRPIPIWSPETLNEEGKPTTSVGEDEIHEQFPVLTQAIHDNRVSIIGVNVYSNYRGGRGQEVFEQEILDRGGDPANIDYNIISGAESPRGAWQGTLRIRGPIEPELEEEIKSIAPNSQTFWLKNGDVKLHSNAVMRAMMLLGAFDAPRVPPMAQVAQWVRTFCRFAAGDPSPTTRGR